MNIASQKIIRAMKVIRMRWVEHAACVGKISNRHTF
jgi:hypothetical protein